MNEYLHEFISELINQEKPRKQIYHELIRIITNSYGHDKTYPTCHATLNQTQAGTSMDAFLAIHGFTRRMDTQSNSK